MKRKQLIRTVALTLGIVSIVGLTPVDIGIMETIGWVQRAEADSNINITMDSSLPSVNKAKTYTGTYGAYRRSDGTNLNSTWKLTDVLNKRTGKDTYVSASYDSSKKVSYVNRSINGVTSSNTVSDGQIYYLGSSYTGDTLIMLDNLYGSLMGEIFIDTGVSKLTSVHEFPHGIAHIKLDYFAQLSADTIMFRRGTQMWLPVSPASKTVYTLITTVRGEYVTTDGTYYIIGYDANNNLITESYDTKLNLIARTTVGNSTDLITYDGETGLYTIMGTQKITTLNNLLGIDKVLTVPTSIKSVLRYTDSTKNLIFTTQSGSGILEGSNTIGSVTLSDSYTFAGDELAIPIAIPNILMSKSIAENREGGITASIESLDDRIQNYYYTTDGTTPTELNGKLWDRVSPIEIVAPDTDEMTTVRLQVIGIKDDRIRTSIVSKDITFGIKLFNVDGINYSINKDSNSVTLQNFGILETTTIPDKVTIDEIQYDVTNLATDALLNSKLTDVTCSNALIDAGQLTFKNATQLVSVKITGNLKIVPESLFDGCSNLTKIDLPSNTESISKNAFKGCTLLTNMVIPENVITIDKTAFTNCTKLLIVKAPTQLVNLNVLTGFNKVQFIDENGPVDLGSYYVKTGTSLVGKIPTPEVEGKVFEKWSKYTVSNSTLLNIQDNVTFKADYIQKQPVVLASPTLTPSTTNATNRQSDVTITIE